MQKCANEPRATSHESRVTSNPSTHRHSNRLLKARIFSILLLAIIAWHCAAPLNEFYPDSYFQEDGVYQNRPLGFSLRFRGLWILVTDPNRMEGEARQFAHAIQQKGGELLFIGSTAEGAQGVRGMAINLNIPARAYAERVREINRKSITEDRGITDIVLDTLLFVKWEYLSYGFRFIEFFFTADTYDVRIAFWTKPDIFERFLPVYTDIMATLSVIDRF